MVQEFNQARGHARARWRYDGGTAVRTQPRAIYRLEIKTEIPMATPTQNKVFTHPRHLPVSRESEYPLPGKVLRVESSGEQIRAI